MPVSEEVGGGGEKSKEEVLAEREARRLAKQAEKAAKKKKKSEAGEVVGKAEDLKGVGGAKDEDSKGVGGAKDKDLKGVGGAKAEAKVMGGAKAEASKVVGRATAEALKVVDRSEGVKGGVKVLNSERVVVEVGGTKSEERRKSKGGEGGGANEEEAKKGEEEAGGKSPVEGGDEKPKEKTKAELRAERRAIQEAQRAAKEAEKQKKSSGEVGSKQPAEIKKSGSETKKVEIKIEMKTSPGAKEGTAPSMKEKKLSVGPKANLNRVKLFSHLQFKIPPLDTKHKLDVHPAIVALGAKYASRVINGSNARCLAFLQAIKQVITDYSTPPEKEFSRGLESQINPAVAYLNRFRSQPVSSTNALKHLKSHINQLPNNVPDDKARAELCAVIDTYIKDQMQVAAVAISKMMRRKIAKGDVILTYACSSLVAQLLIDSKSEGTEFSVVVVDAAPWFEGREMLRRLTEAGIRCTYVLINALSFIMRKVTTVVIGAHAILANGFVMSRAGSSLVALMASSCNVPVLVCCETHKFSERVQMDAFVYNELGDPDEIVGEGSELADWRSWPTLSPLNLLYDITPPDLVTGVVTELAILPCTSVPVVLRVKPSDLPTT